MEETPVRRPQLKLDVLLGVALFVLALAIRLTGLGWGLNPKLHVDSYHPDEIVVFRASQMIRPAEGKFTTGFYNYGTLYLTTLKIASDMTATYTGAPDPKVPGSQDDFMARVILVGRFLSALAGAGTVWAVFLMLRRFATLFGSAFGAGLTVVAPGHIVHSRFEAVDVVGTLFVALATLYAIKLVLAEEDKDLRWALLSGAFAGMAAGTKYTGGLVILTTIAAIVCSPSPARWRVAAGAVAAFAVVFVLSTPGMIQDNAAFVRDLSYEMAHTATGHGVEFVATSPGFLYHLGNLAYGVGPTLSLLGIAGLLIAGWRRHRWAWILLAFFVPYYLLIGRAEVKFLRYTFPLVIGVAAGFGWLMGRAHERKGWSMGIVGLGILGLGGLDGGGLRGAVRTTAWMVGEDPRDAAARYLRSVGQGKVVGLASDPWYYSPPLFRLSTAARWVPLRVRREDWASAKNPAVVFYIPGNESEFNFDTRLLTETRPDYVVFSSIEIRPLERILAAGIQDPIPKLLGERYAAFRRELDQRYVLDRVFGDGAPIHDIEYVQPVISVWKRKSGS